ncbi:MAG TPA: TRAP transporter substrate-binding protein [Syntrophorhabdaceae bacterium]|nr:TRAP transporter substrate-binding protein [Syntrophorhabdaceae bacterium]HNT69193.1 TRAP transporter substrate-binding protein [Syntrophorhabdaceae bacterium]
MRKHCVIWCITCVVAVFFLSSAIPASAQEKVVKLRYSNFFPPVHPISKLAEEWIKEVEKRTNGRVKVSYFPGNTLAPPGQAYDAVVKGIADMAQNLLAYSPGRLPLSEVLQQPLGYASGYQGTKLANEYYKKFKPKEFDDVKVMYLHGVAPGTFHTKKEIKSFDDIKGLRIKANAENAEIVKVLGGAPVTMPITETYDALQKGLAEGILLPNEALKGWRFAEVVKSSLDSNAVSYLTSMYVIMNKNKWNQISKEDQATIEKINEEWIEKQGNLWNKLDKEGKEYAIQKGVKFVKVSKDEEAKVAAKMRPILDEYVKAMKSKNLPGDQALKFCLDYIKAHQ